MGFLVDLVIGIVPKRIVVGCSMDAAESSLLKFLQKQNLLLKNLPEDVAFQPPLMESLEAEGYINSVNCLSCFYEKLGFPIFSLTKTSIATSVLLFDSPRLECIPTWRWSQYRSFPIEATEEKIRIAVSNPFDTDWVKSLSFELGKKVEIEVTLDSHVKAVLAARNHKQIDIELPDSPTLQPQVQEEANLTHSDPSAAPVVKLVDRIFTESIERGASDIHISPEQSDTHVRIRVDGLLQPLLTVPRGFHAATISRIKLLGSMDIAEKRKPQDGRLRLKTGSGSKDLRISSAPTAHGENIVIRILGGEKAQLDFSSLGMPNTIEEQFYRMLSTTSRVVLVTGPTGSGKTSTLYSALQWKNDGKHNIITIEDPIEYRIAGISQIQVNPKIDLSFAEGLRSILRQDPDVIMIGEIRDGETATIAMQSAQTGHLVLSTLHTNSAAAAITRLIDLGVPPFIVSSSLGGIVAQRLVRKKCTCTYTQDCEECHGTGYKGRTAIYSIIEINDEMREAIHRGASENEIETIAAKSGFVSLYDAAKKLVEDGITTNEEIDRVIGTKPQKQKPSPAKAQTSGLKKTKLLLVEDDPDTRWVMAQVFRDHLYDVIEAEDGIDGVKKVYDEVPDVIVSDLMMPKMNGLEFVQKLKNDNQTKSIPVLMLTAAGSEDNEIKSFGHGADDFVSKGSDVKILLARVQRLLSPRI